MNKFIIVILELFSLLVIAYCVTLQKPQGNERAQTALGEIPDQLSTLLCSCIQYICLILVFIVSFFFVVVFLMIIGKKSISVILVMTFVMRGCSFS